MPVRLVIYQRECRPLDGLCAQLQCAGYDIVERYTEAAVLESVSHRHADALLLDSGAEKTEILLERIGAFPTGCSLPIMLIAEESSVSLNQMAADPNIDDVIFLPILRDDLRSRVRNLARLTSMEVELERRLKTFSDFRISRHDLQSGTAANEQSQILLVGPMDDEQVSLIEMLAGTATFTYATTSVHAWHQLSQSYVDMVIVTNKVAPNEVEGLCRRVRANVNLSDLPILILDGSTNPNEIETVCRDLQVDYLRVPFQPIVTKKRLQVMGNRRRLKDQLRGLVVDGLYAPTVDNLTKLYSRGFLYHYLERSIEESRERSAPLSAATCTISGLANVNATLGYPAGDQLISQLARALASSCRAQDLVARSHGSSFCVILNDTSEREASKVCERMAGNLEQIVDQMEGHRLCHISLTIGMAEMTANDKPETLIERALQQPKTVALRQAS